MEEENPKKRSRDQDDSLIIKKAKVNEYQGPQRVAKKTKVYQYGNYSGYYGYRLKPGEIDPRVAAIDIGLLQGKKVLDIGCNSGVFTIQLACHYLPQSILGVDIDNALVNKAKKNVKYWMRRLDCDEAVANIIKFEGGNYLDDHFLVNETYDVIMCFSVTKWVQLNFGDDGIVHMFSKVYDQLKDGGLFILEFQELKSYAKSKRMTETTKQNYKNMQLKPDYFIDVLKELGFQLVNTVQPMMASSQGFERPIYILQKPN